MIATPLNVGVVCDYLEEQWPSMDLVADMLLRFLRERHAGEINPVQLRPTMPRRFETLPIIGASGVARNADRLLGRFVDYPRWLKSRGAQPIYHLVDHSYAHLVHALPAGRAVVTCHDLDTFRSVLEPEKESRGPVFKAMTRRILSGLRLAARVACDSEATRDGILAHELLPPERLDVVYLGVDPILTPDPQPEMDAWASSVLGPPDGSTIDLLHVGSTIPRKRIDVLLRAFAAVRSEFPAARLIRVGGEFTGPQSELLATLRLDPRQIVVIARLDHRKLAALYRRAAIVLQPSDAEGFGLPVAEAMACGVPVVASDLAVLREVGGDGAEYARVGDSAAWSGTVCAMLRERSEDPRAWSRRRERALRQSAQFTWSRFTDQMVAIYRDVAEGVA